MDRRRHSMPYLIAEIGINHNGDIAIARKMIEAASDAGFDAVKFQKRDINACYTAEYLAAPRESPWGKTQRDQKAGLEFSEAQYLDIDKYCKYIGIEWFASAWDLNSQVFLRQFDLPWNKVASPMLAHHALLREIAAERKKTFISTGMATLDEIDAAVLVFTEARCPFELMHCNSTYPMPEDDANLRCIETLRRRYECDVGYSGHETSMTKVCVAAVALGATSIERHITLSKSMYGSDQAASIETYYLRDFVNTMRALPKILGDGEKRILETEKPSREKLRVVTA